MNITMNERLAAIAEQEAARLTAAPPPPVEQQGGAQGPCQACAPTSDGYVPEYVSQGQQCDSTGDSQSSWGCGPSASCGNTGAPE